MPRDMKRVACFWHASILADAWMELSLSSLKFDFLSHPSAVVLSVIDKTQSWLFRRPARMSTHGEIIAARCSSRLFDARKRRFFGRYHLHAQPLLLYPPNPARHESDL
jgi:hypothetical protein